MDKSKLYEVIPPNDLPVTLLLYSDLGEHKFYSHWHEHLELHYIIEGHSVVWCEGQTTEVSAGECLVINCNELHEGVGGNSKYFCIILPPSLLEEGNLIYNKVINDKEIAKIIENIMYEYTHYEKSSHITIKGYIYLLIAHLRRNHIYKEFDNAGYTAYSEKTAFLNKAIKHIKDNYREEISLDTMADITNVNKYYFCHIFKEYTGKTLKEYINSLRIQKAEELLIGTDIPITEVAYMCGFNDSNYFSRKFKQVTGKAPREVRK